MKTPIHSPQCSRPESSVTLAATLTAFRLSLIGALISLFASCATKVPPKPIHTLMPDASGGIALMVDVSIQRDSVGTGGDYFVIKEAEDEARAALGELRKSLKPTGLRVRGEIASVCATQFTRESQTICVAEQVGASSRQARRPAKVSGSAGADDQLAKAIVVVSTYAFERAGVSQATKSAQLISVAEFQNASKVIQGRTNASNLLYLGASGISLSTGKKVGSFLGKVAIGTATGVLTAGMGTGYAVMFIPGSTVNGMTLKGAIIDLRTGTLTWSNAVSQPGDPMKAGKVANRATMDRLFLNVSFQPATQSSP